MKLEKKLLAVAKGISLWWGIYLILGCCAGFVVQMINNFFTLSYGYFELKLYIPVMAAASLILGTISYFISSAAKRAPAKKMKRRLFKMFKDEKLSDGLMSELMSNATGDMKNHVLVISSMLYSVKGDTASAEEVLSRADLVSVLDIAQSTGNFKTAAYYYCAKMILAVLTHDKDGAVRAYDDGIYYLEAFSANDIVLTVLAIYQTEASLYNSAADTLKKIKWRTLPSYLKKYGRSLCSAILAVNLVNLGQYDEAVFHANISLENSCSDYVTDFAEDVIRRARSARKTEEVKASESEKNSE
ncbi:MAG: hypothetical protein K2N71_03025 [Oscillospiraceae bacterium]|nr:hypothetical protein [Oscillospiraceae bacterium]